MFVCVGDARELVPLPYQMTCEVQNVIVLGPISFAQISAQPPRPLRLGG